MAESVTNTDADQSVRPWAALWALCLGFFMILVDATIVSVATPTIQHDLHASENATLWVTSAYLLAYAVPLLITGRLGDRVGPKNLYLIGLAVFTLSSLWCGLTGTIAELIVARVVQGLGAAMITPQTMAVITRVFPPIKRGQAMGVWGAVAGVATLVGPVLGGVLVDGLGWEWIFFINVPVGVIGFALAMGLVPRLPTHTHSFDIPGVVLSAVGMFLLVFGIQEGQTYHWNGVIWGLILVGVAVLVAFVLWQHYNRREPLVPLSLFRDRNFSLANVAITAVGFAIIGMSFPIMYYAQVVEALTPLRSALLLIPMAVLSGVLAPFVGRLSDRVHPRYVAGVGLLCFPVSLVWLAAVMSPHQAIWQLELPIALLGVANGFMWSPLSTTATRNLPMRAAGAGSGIYNTTRQVGAVLGTAAIAVLIQSRLSANLHGFGSGSTSHIGSSARLPAALQSGFSDAMAQALLLPAAVMVFGLLAAMCFERPGHLRRRPAPAAPPPAAGQTVAEPVG
jgi:EmrB/QacA subfamily drug resistance transporter